MARKPIPKSELESPLESYMRALFTEVLTSMSRNLGNGDMTMRELAALHLLDQRKQMRIGELAEELGHAMPGTSRLVSEMVSRGIFARHESPEDRRAKVVSLTRKGQDLIDTISRDRMEKGDAALENADGEVSLMMRTVFEQMRAKGLATKDRPKQS
jgi:DNA-binding MarR family transcriptional regulator